MPILNKSPYEERKTTRVVWGVWPERWNLSGDPTTRVVVLLMVFLSPPA